MAAVIVTGAASGIGLAVVRDLARDHDVLASDLDADRLAAALNGVRCSTRAADVTDEQAVDDMVEVATRSYGRLDGLVHCAGVEEDSAPVTEMTTDTFRRVVDVNLVGSFLVGRAAAKAMVATGVPGSIVMIGSILSEVAYGGNAAYTASKGGVRQLARALAVDLAPHRIRVNTIGPGVVATPMSQASIDDPVRGPQLLTRIPLGRFATADDVAQVARFLIDAADYVTGTFVPVDGGWLSL